MKKEKDITDLQSKSELPDLSLGDRTIAFLSKILLDVKSDELVFENGKSDKISERLRSGKDGFFDKTKFPSVTL